MIKLIPIRWALWAAALTLLAAGIVLAALPPFPAQDIIGWALLASAPAMLLILLVFGDPRSASERRRHKECEQ